MEPGFLSIFGFLRKVRDYEKGVTMAAKFDLVNQDIFDAKVEIKQIRVHELLKGKCFEETTLYTFSALETFKGLLQPDDVFVLIDGYQVEDLNEIVSVTQDTHIEVVRVVQL